MPWPGSKDPCSLLAFCPPFSHQTNTGSGMKETVTQSSKSSSIFHILCLGPPARGATAGPHMLQCAAPPGLPHPPLTKRSAEVELTAFHTVRFWDCPGTSEHWSDCLSAQARARVSPQNITALAFCISAWHDPGVSSVGGSAVAGSTSFFLVRASQSKHWQGFTGVQRSYRMARDIHNGFGRLKIELTPSSWTWNNYGCFNTCLFLASISLY